MPTHTAAITRPLAHHEVSRHAGPVRLRALRGSLWVTVDGKPDDILIDAGQARSFDGRTPVLASALGGPALLAASPLTATPRPIALAPLAPLAWLRRLALKIGAPRAAALRGTSTCAMRDAG